MSGGVTQLISIGSQDMWITGDPQVSFFKSSYMRHTNFAQIVSRQIIQGAPNSGSVSTVRFEKKGDLMSHVFLTKKVSGSLDVFDPADIQYIDLLINGQVVDTQYSDFLFNVSDLLASTPNRAATSQDSVKFFPLHFWFCESWQSALPMINFVNSDVEIRITWASNANVGTPVYECHANYIYLDDAERQSMKSNGSKKFLIYQVQRQPASGLAVQQLIFNNPVKFLVASSAIVTDPNALVKFQINGVDISDEKCYDQHYNAIPYYYNCYYNTGLITTGPGFLHTFCLDTSKIQPSGSVNFSRIDSARLTTSGGATFSFSDYIYAVSYNMLEVNNGIAGLMYCN